MNRIRLGRTGLMVSEIGFGGIPITRLGPTEAADLIDHCLDRGIDLFDTANGYGDSEEKLGRSLGRVRTKVILATKTLATEADKAAEHLEKSLANLATDYIDVYQLHNVSEQKTLDQLLVPGGVYEMAVRAKEAGKIRFIGISSHNPTVALTAVQSNLFDTLQFPLNFIEDTALETLFPAADRMGLGLMAMKPLGGGLLSPADLCFRWLQQHPAIVPLPGFATKAEVDRVVGLYDHPRPLSQTEREAVDAVRAELGQRFCRRCGYCKPCPQEIDIPLVLLFKSISLKNPVERAIDMATKFMPPAQECEACGECVERCPYHLPVPEMIQEALDYYQDYLRQHSQASRRNF